MNHPPWISPFGGIHWFTNTTFCPPSQRWFHGHLSLLLALAGLQHASAGPNLLSLLLVFFSAGDLFWARGGRGDLNLQGP